MNKEYVSPFLFRTNTGIVLRNSKAKGISSERMSFLWQDGTITEEDITIISLVYHMNFLTSRMIQDCFESGEVPKDMMRLPGRNISNPYKKALAKLEHFGVLIVYSFHNGEVIAGPKIYTLSKGATLWFKTFNAGSYSYFLKNVPHNYAVPEKYINYKYILNTLAANHFHIKTVSVNRQSVLAYFPLIATEDYAANFYQFFKNRCVIEISIRTHSPSDINFDDIFEIIKSLSSQYHLEPFNVLVLFNTDTLDASGILNRFIKTNELLKEYNTMYITDYSIHHEENTFKSLIVYNGTDNNSYSRVELNIN